MRRCKKIVASGAASVDYVNTFGLLDLAVSDPGAFGLTNVTQPVWTGNLTGGNGRLTATGAAQNGHLFFDDLHPTAAGHALLADAVTQGLTPGRSDAARDPDTAATSWFACLRPR